MTETLCPVVEGVANRLRAGCLARMDGEVDSGRSDALQSIGEGSKWEAVLGSGDVDADNPGSMVDGEVDDIVRDVEMSHQAQDLPHDDGFARFGGGRHSLQEAGLDCLGGLRGGQTTFEMLLGSPSSLGVHDSVGSHVLDEFSRYAAQGVSILHEGDGLGESVEIPGQGTGVSGLEEPVGKPLRRVGRDGSAALGSEVQNRRRA